MRDPPKCKAELCFSNGQRYSSDTVRTINSLRLITLRGTYRYLANIAQFSMMISRTPSPRFKLYPSVPSFNVNFWVSFNNETSFHRLFSVIHWLQPNSSQTRAIRSQLSALEKNQEWNSSNAAIRLIAFRPVSLQASQLLDQRQ